MTVRTHTPDRLFSVLLPALCSLLLAAPALAADDAPATEQPAAAAVPTVEQLLIGAEKTLADISDYTGIMTKQERFLEEMGRRERTRIKFAKPFKVYIKFLNVHGGREAIYVRGWNDNEVKVHKGTFPDINVNLDPRGSMAMDGNHHPITDFGLANTCRVAAENLRRAVKRKEGEFKVTDAGTVNGRPVWKIEANFPKGGHLVTAREDETLWDIADRTGQDMYLILYTNRKQYDEPDDVDEGDRVFIPRYYGGKAEFVLDKEYFTPVRIRTWDWDGRLYESYDYQDMEFNVGLTRRDFDPDNPAYDF